MKKYTRNLLCWFTSTAVLLGIVLCCFLYAENFSLAFYISAGNVSVKIDAYETENGIYYVFLPSHASLSDTKISLPKNRTISIDNITLNDGSSCEKFELNTSYVINFKGKESSIQFLQSDNVPALYINTATGTMERIHEDRTYRETSELILITENQKVEYHDNNCTVKGRGNSTWRYEKKPYNLTLSSEKDLLGMKNSTNWCLLANALDYSNLNNKLALDVANKVNFYWAPQCAYVDVYLNGYYNGLYLLVEEIEISEEKLDIDVPNGDFLCSVDFQERWDRLDNPFITNSGRIVDIRDIEDITSEQFETIKSQVNGLEMTIFSQNNLNLASNFDMDSWARRYLIDEIFCNIDSDITSSFFYSKDGIIYGGPVWDYDMSLGNTWANRNPEALYAKLLVKHSGNISTYYNALYANQSFYNRMREIYVDEFVPILNELTAFGIEELSASIEKASYMNNLRWAGLFEYLSNAKKIIDPLERSEPLCYLNARVEFLNRIWVDNEEFYSVQIDPTNWNGSYNYSVKKGGSLSDIQVLQTGEWIIEDSGEIFIPNDSVERDVILIPRKIEVVPTAPSSREVPTNVIVCILSVLLVTSLLICFIVIEVRRYYRR